MNIADVKIGARHRKDLGDVAALAESIRAEGLLQPIGVTPDNELVFGTRRLTACRDHLGWTEIDARVVNVSSIANGEYAENEMRKDFTVSERVAILESIERKKLGDNQYGLQNFATLNEAAKLAGFGNRETARQATIVINDGAPELVEAVDKGEIAISTGAIIAKAPKEKQREVVQKKRKVRTPPDKEPKGKAARPRKETEPKESNGRATPQLDKARAIIRPLMLAGKSMNSHTLQEEHGISHALFDSAKTAERARLETFDELGVSVDDPRRQRPFGPYKKPEVMVGVKTLTELFVPLFDEVKDQSKRHVARLDRASLRIVASRGHRLLKGWANDDAEVLRLLSRIAPGEESDEEEVADGPTLPAG